MMLIESGKIAVKLQNSHELVEDIQCAIATFIKMNKQCDVPDELIEKALVEAIAHGFNRLDHIHAAKIDTTGLSEEDAMDVIDEIFENLMDEENEED